MRRRRDDTMTKSILQWMLAGALLWTLAGCGDTAETDAGVTDNAVNNAVNNAEACEGARCQGSAYPQWVLQDFQVSSPRFEQSYGPADFDSKVTVVVLLAGWCPFCQSQALFLEELDAELDAEGFDVNFVIVNDITANTDEYRENLLFIRGEDGELTTDDDGELVRRCTAPMFQDVEEIGAWAMHGGKKDDIAIYNADGTLNRYLDRDVELPRLSTEEGYQALKQAILAAF